MNLSASGAVSDLSRQWEYRVGAYCVLLAYEQSLDTSVSPRLQPARTLSRGTAPVTRLDFNNRIKKRRYCHILSNWTYGVQ